MYIVLYKLYIIYIYIIYNMNLYNNIFIKMSLYNNYIYYDSLFDYIMYFYYNKGNDKNKKLYIDTINYLLDNDCHYKLEYIYKPLNINKLITHINKFNISEANMKNIISIIKEPNGLYTKLILYNILNTNERLSSAIDFITISEINTHIIWIIWDYFNNPSGIFKYLLKLFIYSFVNKNYDSAISICINLINYNQLYFDKLPINLLDPKLINLQLHA